MTPDDLLAELERRGIRLQKMGARLQVNAPQSCWDSELRGQVIEHKAALMQHLTQDDQPGAETHGSPSRGGILAILLIVVAVVLVISLLPVQQPDTSESPPPAPSIDPWTRFQGWY